MHTSPALPRVAPCTPTRRSATAPASRAGLGDYLANVTFKNGDVVSTPARVISSIRHVGIWDEEAGLFIHNNSPGGVQYITASDFINGSFIILKRAAPGRDGEAVRRARAMIGREYDTLTFNCEHFVNYVTEGQKTSPQLNSAVTTSLLGGLAVWALRALFGPQYDENVDRYRDGNGRFVSR